MKKALLLGAAALLALPSFAAPVTPGEAMQRASGTPSAACKIQSAPMRLVKTGELDGTPSYYIFTGNGGSMILSADTRAVAVLGYLDAPVDENVQIPPQLLWWLECAARDARDAAEPAGEASPKTSDFANISPLLSTKWNQTAPYNNACPGKSVTGCSATAMAQVMKYHEWPASGTGTVTCTFNDTEYTMDLSEITFDWDNMLDTYQYSSSGNTIEKRAVANLMKACGYAIKSIYSTTSTGAYAFDVAAAFVNNFGYDKGLQFLCRDYFSPDEWEQKVYDELSASRPLYYSGYNSSSGHAFVCDGYNNKYGFHFNWGWNGAYDGYFAMNYLVPDGSGTGGSAAGYTNDQSAMFGVQPPVEGSTAVSVRPFLTGAIQGSVDGDRLVITFANNGMCSNISYLDWKGTIGYAAVGTDGNLDVQTIISSTLPANYGFPSFTASLEALSDGVYHLRLYYKNDGEDNWSPVTGKYGAAQTLRIIKNNDSYSITPVDNLDSPDGQEIPDDKLEFTAGHLSEVIYANSTFDWTISIKNNGSESITKNFGLTCRSGGTADAQTSVQVTNYETVTIDAGETVTKAFSLKIPFNTTPGRYNICLIDDSQTTFVSAPVVIEEHRYAEFEVNEETIGIVAGGNNLVAVTISNIGNAASPEVDFKLKFGYINGNVITNFTEVADFGTRSCVMEAGETRTFEFAGFVDANVDTNLDYVLRLTHNNVTYPLADLPVTLTVVSGMDGIDAEEGDVRWFDLQGHEISRPAAAGIYIKVCNNASQKVRVK